MNLMRSRKNGFTLMELLLVIGILGILSVISFSSILGAISRGRDAQRKSDISLLKKGIEQYANDLGEYPYATTDGKVACSGTSQNPVSCTNSFSYSVNGELVTPITKYPVDPSSNTSYFYELNSDGYVLYAALENINDKDIYGGTLVLPQCGSVVCNYKVTNSGLVKE